MKTYHCVVLLLALVVAPFTSATDDDQTDQEEYCEDTSVCEGDMGKQICAGPEAGVRMSVL